MDINTFLSFSDAVKGADIARNLINGFGYYSNFTFWTTAIFSYLKQNILFTSYVSPVSPFSIAIFFEIFGIRDFSVIATSFFYFILTLVFTYLLASKTFNSKWVGALSTLAVGANYDLIHYATSGASESPFIFEIVAASYFVSLKKKWATVLTLILLILMYFTRPQAFIYIAGVILYWLLVNFGQKRALVGFVGLMFVGLLVDYIVLRPLSGKFFLYSIVARGFGSSFNQSSVASNTLRGAATASGGIIQILKNIFYNLYNFYKLLPQIISPYLFALFTIGLFKWGKDKIQNSFKAASVFMIVVTLLVTAASIPFFRYIHPIIPLVYIIAVGTIVEIIKWSASLRGQITNYKLAVLVSTFLIILFGVGQTLGIIFLDSRFERNTHNVGKPPVYVELSKILKENTDPSQVVVTNLDTWGSWYGERKTIWFPVTPKQIIDPVTGKVPFNAIYLTSYLIDDPNYYMGTDWRLIFSNPTDSKKWTCDGCGEIANEFKFRGMYKVSASSDYERQDASAILLIRK